MLTGGSMAISAAIGGLACGPGKVLAQSAAAPVHHHGNPDVFDAANGCVGAGTACLAHCIMLLAGGDTSMADCAQTVVQMRAVLEGVAAVAAIGGKNLSELVKVAAKFCADCEAACRKHEAQHPTCKACAEACAKAVAVFAKA